MRLVVDAGGVTRGPGRFNAKENSDVAATDGP